MLKSSLAFYLLVIYIYTLLRYKKRIQKIYKLNEVLLGLKIKKKKIKYKS